MDTLASQGLVGFPPPYFKRYELLTVFHFIGSWYADYLPTTTWEGDNYMLTQQVARYVRFLS